MSLESGVYDILSWGYSHLSALNTHSNVAKAIKR